MVRPEKKLKKILLIIGITGAVYGGFKYLLPLVVPFLLAYGTALFLRPSVRFLEHRLRIGKKKRKLPTALVGGTELILLFGILFGILYLGGVLLFQQLGLFMSRFPQWLEQADIWLTKSCASLAQAMGLRTEYLTEIAKDMIQELGRLFKNSTMPMLMNHSMPALKLVIEAIIFLIIYFAAVIFSLQEMEDIRERRSRSTFHREFSLIGKRLSSVVSAWLKTQLIIMTMTSILCILGLAIIKNPYSVLFGIGIGLLDALPIFGTGTVLIPWGILLLIQKQWWPAIVILALYVICYFLRQIFEAKLMGDQVGLTPLESLASMYAGLQLFGIAGFLLGPLGLLLIEDLFEMYSPAEAPRQTPPRSPRSAAPAAPATTSQKQARETLQGLGNRRH